MATDLDTGNTAVATRPRSGPSAQKPSTSKRMDEATVAELDAHVLNLRERCLAAEGSEYESLVKELVDHALHTQETYPPEYFELSKLYNPNPKPEAARRQRFEPPDEKPSKDDKRRRIEAWRANGTPDGGDLKAAQERERVQLRRDEKHCEPRQRLHLREPDRTRRVLELEKTTAGRRLLEREREWMLRVHLERRAADEAAARERKRKRDEAKEARSAKAAKSKVIKGADDDSKGKGKAAKGQDNGKGKVVVSEKGGKAKSTTKSALTKADTEARRKEMAEKAEREKAKQRDEREERARRRQARLEAA